MNETPLNYMANVAIGGGNDNTRFKLSLTQTDDRGTIKGSGVRRTNINLKLATNLHKNLKFNYSPTMTYRRDEGAGGDNIGTGGIIDVLRYMPTKGYRQFAKWNSAWEDADVAQAFNLTNPVRGVIPMLTLKCRGIPNPLPASFIFSNVNPHMTTQFS
jgi:hypothetical protein